MTHTRTIYLSGIKRDHFIASVSAGDEAAADRKAAQFIQRLMSHPAQAKREYYVR